MASKPIVTIGLPVYNGETYLAAAIESVLSQTFTEYQIIISDNGSTDETQQICEQYESEYEHISYYRSDTNKGAAWNFRRVFELCATKYFKWMAHDDLIAPSFLEKCVAALEQHRDAVIAYPLTTLINERSQVVGEYSHKIATDAPTAHKRFHDLLFDSDQCFEVFGVIRSDCLRQTEVMGNYGHADGVLLNHLSLMGYFHEVPEQLFYSRRHGQQSVKVHLGENTFGRPDYYAYTTWFDPKKRNRIFFPNWRILVENLKVIHRSRISTRDSLYCYFFTLKWIKRHRTFLWGDLTKAARQMHGQITRSSKRTSMSR